MGTTYTYKQFPLLVFGVVILLALAGCENKNMPTPNPANSQIISATILQAYSDTSPVPANMNDVSLFGGADIKAAGSAVRTIAATIVSIQITPPAGTAVWGVEEHLPEGLAVATITGPNGVWDAVNRKLSWWNTGDAAATLTYNVAGISGTYELSGTANFDGAAVNITGDMEMRLGDAGSAVRAIDGKTVTIHMTPGTGTDVWGVEELIPPGLTVSNITGENALWDSGNRKLTWWSTNSSATTLGYTTDGLSGTYSLEGTLNADGIDYPVTGDTQIVIESSGAAVRTVTGFQVAVAVEPAAGTLAWGVEESIPAGLVVSDIVGQNGEWDSNNSKVSWWDTDDTPALLGYSVSGLTGTYLLAGNVTFDGVVESVTGASEVVLDSESACLRVIEGSHVLVHIHPAPGTAVWGAEEILPADLGVSSLSGPNGAWDEIKHKVSWWNAGDTAYTLEYTVSGDQGVYALSGKASFDGADLSSTGPTLLVIGFPGEAVRSVAGTTVNIQVQPATATAAWGLEEYIPTDLSVSAITGPNGSWDAINRKISWWSTGITPVSLGYTVSGASGTYILSGNFNVDGIDRPVSGSTRVIVGNACEIDVTPPQITVNGLTDLNVECGEAYVDAGATAVDNCDDDIAGKVVVGGDDTNTTALGTYTITYDVIDASGNPATQATRRVTIVDATAPVITALGETAVQTECGEAYVDAGAVAWDDCEGDISDNIVVENAVDTTTPGTYQVIYRATDASGNEAIPVTAIVTVADTVKPVIELSGPSDIPLDCGEPYADLGATAQDNCAGVLPVTITGVVNTNQPGIYELTYTAVDYVGNTASASRTITVRDNCPIEGEGETLPEGEAPIEGEGEGEVPTEGEGEVPAEGEGEGETLGEGEGEILYEGETASEGEGEIPAEGEGEISAEGEGEVLPEGEGEVPFEGEGETPAEGEGEVPVEGEGEMPVEGEGEALSEGEGEFAPEGEAPIEGEGETSIEDEGEVALEGEGEILPEGEGETTLEGEATVEGETLAEGEGEDEGEGEIEDESCGCCASSSKSLDTLLGDWLMIGLALMALAVVSHRIKG